MKKTKLMLGDNMESLKKLPENSIDSIVTDPPYGLSFMGKKWDYDVPSVEFWKEVYRVLKPGGHILSFGGTRTYHRMVVNIEDAGFEIRDQVMWLYGSGFPKSHNIGKAVDKLEGNEREVVGEKEQTGAKFKSWSDDPEQTRWHNQGFNKLDGKTFGITKGQSKYEGWGTALKPANEPICVARKPLSEKTIAENVIKWGTGGINIDGCRVGSEVRTTPVGSDDNRNDETLFGLNKTTHHERVETTEGRFPANIILDEIAAELLDEQSGVSKSNTKQKTIEGKEAGQMYHKHEQPSNNYKQKVYVGDYSDKGGASRFFYVAKVSKKERNLGLDGFEEKEREHSTSMRCGNCNLLILAKNSCKCEVKSEVGVKSKNTHPTLKPINLMTYLCRLVTPEGGIVLDPFMGSGSTGISALLEGFRFVGMEMDKDYFKIATARIEAYEEYRPLLKNNITS